MKIGLVQSGLILTVGTAWLSAAAFARFKAPLDRLHSVAFFNVSVGASLCLAALAADGWSSRSVKIIAIAILSVVTGAGISHAIGRAITYRGERQ